MVFKNKKYIKYTWKHKIAFLKVEKIVLGKNTIRGYLHGTEKLFLYLFLPKKTVSRINRSMSRHHVKRARTESDFTQMMIDWECARFTKADKPLDAYETLYKFYPQLQDKMIPLFQKYKIKEKMESISKL